MTETKQIQKEITGLLNKKLYGNNVSAKEEWDVSKNSGDEYSSREIYAPRVDIAVSPYITGILTSEEINKLENAYIQNKNLIEEIKKKGETFSDFRYNKNPRCLITIEIETSGSRKHLLGDIANASILGKVGLIVPTNDKNYNSFRRIMNYLEFAQTKEKISENIFKNIILIRHSDLIDILKEFNSHREYS